MEEKMGESCEDAHELRERLLDEEDHQQEVEQEPTTPPRSESTAFLDGLRGLAALFVFVQHYIGSFDANVHEHGFGEDGNYYIASLPFLRILFNGGNAAVAIFFVLSGYVLAKSPLKLLRNNRRKECRMSVISAVVRRPFRLYLPPLAVALICALMMHAPFPLMEHVPWNTPKESIWAELRNWFVESVRFYQPFQSHGSSKQWYYYNIVAWTLPVELKGSMLVYLTLFLHAFSRLGRRATMLVLSVIAIVLLHLGWWSMPCFIAGLVLAFSDMYSMDTNVLGRYLTKQGRTALVHTSFVIGYYLLCQPAHAGSPDYSLNTPGWNVLTQLIPRAYDGDHYYRYWQSWGALLVVYACLRLQWLQTFLHTRPLRFLGKVSFMLYLVHLPFFQIFGNRLARFFGQTFGDSSSWWDNKIWVPDVGPVGLSTRWLLCVAIVLPATLAVAYAGTRAIDMPSMKFARKLTQLLGLDKKRSNSEDDRARLPVPAVHPQLQSQ